MTEERQDQRPWERVVNSMREFLPEAALTNSRNADLYRSWRDAGWLTLTPDEVVD
jgi:hypothetical protein